MKRILVGLTGLFGATLYISLSFWGWGGWAGYFDDPARLAFVVIILVASVSAAFTDSSGLGSGVHEDKSNRWVLVPLILGGMLLPWLTAYLDKHNEWVWGGEPLRWIGDAITAIGCTVRMLPVFQLGRRFSGLVAIQPDHKLETGGMYRTIRHPSYLGLLLSTFGFALVFRCLAAGILITAFSFAVLTVRMNSEEKLLLAQFGEQYAAYKMRTWRLVPGVY